jgi:2,3-bisphosphoglycerate-dependent phosphoglycerate mutase
MSARVLLLRHAHSQPAPDQDESAWPLSARGRAQAQALIAPLRALQPQRLFASPYQRAMDTLQPLADAMAMPITPTAALRECAFRHGTAHDWPAPIARAWQAPATAAPGCESARNCQRRMVNAIDQLVRGLDRQCAIVASHGNAIALLLNHMDASFDYEAWRAMPMPALFEVDWQHNRYRPIALPQ